MKPALEPIIVFQKPYKGKPVDSIVETGAGALNIDGARVPATDKTPAPVGQFVGSTIGPNGHRGERDGRSDELGRWPANFYLDDEAARRLGKQSGHLTSGAHTGELATEKKNQVYGHFNKANINVFQASEGIASRFFFNVNRQLDEADPVLYQAKASRKERDAGIEALAEQEGGHANASGRRYGGGNRANWQDPYKRPQVRNSHPCCKPIDLTRWLATLLLPPDEYAPRRILVPFAGSGSEMIGAHLAGWEEIVGIEMERDYCEIAEARLAHWCHQPKQLELVL